MTFKELAIGEKFTCNGNYCTKKSNKTAYIDRDKLSLWFYYGQKEIVKKGW